MGVKRTTIDLLAGLGIIPDYKTTLRYTTDLAGKGMVTYPYSPAAIRVIMIISKDSPGSIEGTRSIVTR